MLPNAARASLPATAWSFAGDAGQGSRVLRDGLGDDAVVDELAFAAAFDESGVGEDFQMMGNGGGRDAAHGHEFAAHHFFLGGDGLKNHEAGGVGQSL
jgi:hypothetical protein